MSSTLWTIRWCCKFSRIVSVGLWCPYWVRLGLDHIFVTKSRLNQVKDHRVYWGSGGAHRKTSWATTYADDTQLIAHLTINEISNVAIQGSKIASKQSKPGATQRQLHLNPTKTELTWFGSKTNLDVADINFNLYFGPDNIKLVNLDCDLGVYLFISMKYV